MKEFLWILFGALIAAAIGTAVAQRVPSEFPGCVYNTTPPTLTNGQVSTLQCDVNGKLKVNTT